MTRRSSAPYWIKTRYGGVCSRCKLGIKKGEDALYYPANRTMLCAGQCCGRQEQADIDANRFDEAMYSYGRALAVVALAVFCRFGSSQALPDAPKPHIDRTEFSLLATDSGIRALDVYSTHQMLKNGHHELFLPASIAKHPAAMGAVEAGDVAAAWWISRKLEKRGHKRLAHILTALDVAQDAPWAIHNLFLSRKKATNLIPFRMEAGK